MNPGQNQPHVFNENDMLTLPSPELLLILNAIQDTVVILDTDGTIRYSNAAAGNTLGLITGLHISETLQSLGPVVDQILSDQCCRFGISIHKGTRFFQAKLQPFSNADGFAGVLCILEDKTVPIQLAQQVNAHKQLSQELETIFENSREGMVIMDGDANVLRINSSSERINNIQAREFIGKNMHQIVEEGYLDKSVALESIKTKSVVNMLQRTRDGHKLSVTVKPIFNNEGEIIRLITNEWDITEIDKLHRELEEQEAMKNQFRRHIMDMQLEKQQSSEIIAKSTCMINTLHQALKVAEVESTVFLSGESGVGKGLIARLIHKHSHRSKQPMIEINCGAIPESLLEAELFGYEKGAFTGADPKGKPGYFELADKGILFLDEIAELQPSSQVKLLRFLEDGDVIRVGGTKLRTLDVRVIAATNRNLEEMVKAGTFRQDLYYRLHVIPLNIPPLRERQECILPLINHYMDNFSSRQGIIKKIQLTRRAIDALRAYSYPGNVRELKNICERMTVMSENNRIDVADLPVDLLQRFNDQSNFETDWSEQVSLAEIMKRVEHQVFQQALEQYGSQAAVAEVLGINQSTVARKLKKMGISKP
ncbi:MAG: sigma 54-interacting transcriptional regulator [Desulfobacterales bacterium]|nr:sigma 54-interacting transcriptional regulator [Desulfobacterales bacterium]